ncbi:MAG: hypothetical protein ACC707_16420 [Thiohalomonadales bacterium]
MSKKQNRNDFPQVAKIIDAFRKQFPGLNVFYVKENGKEFKK